MSTIESQDLKLVDVFRDFYTVPNYQREYVWTEEEVEQLLGDIRSEHVDGANSEYFIGSIVVCPGMGERFDLIDGQQRMTTLFVTICALRDRLEARDTRGHGGPAFTNFAKLRCKLCVSNIHQRLVLLNDRAFLHQKRLDDAALKALDDLGLTRRDNLAVAALDLVQHRKMCPNHKGREQRGRRGKQHPRRAWGSQVNRGSDIVCKCKIRSRHWA